MEVVREAPRTIKEKGAGNPWNKRGGQILDTRTQPWEDQSRIQNDLAVVR